VGGWNRLSEICIQISDGAICLINDKEPIGKDLDLGAVRPLRAASCEFRP